MPPQILTDQDLERFHTEGYVVVRDAFCREDAFAMQREWWCELFEVHGIEEGDPDTWRQPMGDLKRPKQSPLEQQVATRTVRHALDELLGRGHWEPPANWGRALVTFPEDGHWDVPTGWHWDNFSPRDLEPLPGLFVVAFVAEVAPRSGGTLLLAGSHRLLRRYEATLSPDELNVAFRIRRERFFGSHPWLSALNGAVPSPPDRIAAFMDRETDLDGVTARVVELTGQPGDMVFCQPDIVHCAAPNRGTRPRFMRIKPLLRTVRDRRR